MENKELSNIIRIALIIVAIPFGLAVSAQSQTESILYSFTGARDDASPNPGLTLHTFGGGDGSTLPAAV